MVVTVSYDGPQALKPLLTRIYAQSRTPFHRLSSVELRGVEVEDSTISKLQTLDVELVRLSP
jgi:hypothetical protein